MIYRIFLLLIISLPLPLQAQSDPWDHWKAEVVRSLNTAGTSKYLNEEEKKVILFMNMVRHDGTLFAETFLDRYVQEKQLETSSYIRSLRRDLKKTTGLMPFIPEDDLTMIAQDHALESASLSMTG